MERTYNFRPMEATDVFRLTSILAKIGIKDIKKYVGNYVKNGQAEGMNKKEMALNLGLDIVDMVLNNIENCEEPLYRFIANVSDLSEQEIKTMKGAEFITLLYDLFGQEDYMDFFKAVLRFRK